MFSYLSRILFNGVCKYCNTLNNFLNNRHTRLQHCIVLYEIRFKTKTSAVPLIQ